MHKEYTDHIVFEKLLVYSNYYKNLSGLILGFASLGTSKVYNIDTYTYSSIQGTLESIHDILKKGRINDSYALLRKYYDSIIINIYTVLYLKDHVSAEEFIVEKIDNWLQGSEALPEYRVMNNYVRSSNDLKSLNHLLFKDDTYKNIRDRCNNHVHYNFFRYVLLNDNEINFGNRTKSLDIFLKDLDNIFVLHFCYLFTVNPHYMASTDYVDSLDLGLIADENSQYYVAPFIQTAFNDIKVNRPDLAEEIKNNSIMYLE